MSHSLLCTWLLLIMRLKRLNSFKPLRVPSPFLFSLLSVHSSHLSEGHSLLCEIQDTSLLIALWAPSSQVSYFIQLLSIHLSVKPQSAAPTVLRFTMLVSLVTTTVSDFKLTFITIIDVKIISGWEYVDMFPFK